MVNTYSPSSPETRQTLRQSFGSFTSQESQASGPAAPTDHIEPHNVISAWRSSKVSSPDEPKLRRGEVLLAFWWNHRLDVKTPTVEAR